MKKYYLLLVAITMMVGLTSDLQLGKNATQEKMSSGVYICTGPSSKRYHSTSNCRGLGSCSGNVVKMSLAKAREKGRTPCKICYK